MHLLMKASIFFQQASCLAQIIQIAHCPQAWGKEVQHPALSLLFNLIFQIKKEHF